MDAGMCFQECTNHFVGISRNFAYGHLRFNIARQTFLLAVTNLWKTLVSRRRLLGNHRARGAHFQPLEMVLVIFWFYNLTPRGREMCIGQLSSVSSSITYLLVFHLLLHLSLLSYKNWRKMARKIVRKREIRHRWGEGGRQQIKAWEVMAEESHTVIQIQWTVQILQSWKLWGT